MTERSTRARPRAAAAVPATRSATSTGKVPPPPRAEPSKAKLKRDAQRKSADRERGLAMLVDAANAKRDPLEAVGEQRAYERNGLSAGVECFSGPALGDADMRFCADLLASNMRAQYKAAGWGWSDAAKKRALGDPASRVLLIRARESPTGAADPADEWVFVGHNPEGGDAEQPAPPPGNLGFVLLQFCMEGDRPTLYLLELQLARHARGKGLGKFAMQLLEQLARKHRMQCIMLTVFKANVDALSFYQSLRYDVDESSPSLCGVPDSSYEIMSKRIDDPARGKRATSRALEAVAMSA